MLDTEGKMVSHDYIDRVLDAEGFARLPKRTQIERKRSSSKILKAPRSQAIDWEVDNAQVFHSERGIGVLPFPPLLARLGVDRWIESASYPQTSEINRVQSVLCLLKI